MTRITSSGDPQRPHPDVPARSPRSAATHAGKRAYRIRKSGMDRASVRRCLASGRRSVNDMARRPGGFSIDTGVGRGLLLASARAPAREAGPVLVRDQQTQATMDAEPLVPYESLYSKLDNLRAEYASGDPYSHVVMDDFLSPEVIQRMLGEFPGIASGEWIHYVHYNERKFGKTDREAFGPTIGAVVDELNSPRFLRFLQDVTGIEDLLQDDSLEGGGLHQSERGGFLN